MRVRFNILTFYSSPNQRHCLCKQTYESLCSTSLLSYHISPWLLSRRYLSPLQLFLGVLHLSHRFISTPWGGNPSSSYRHDTQKRSDSDSKVGECFIGVAGSYYI